MSTCCERCPHCFAPLAGMTNGFGGVYLQCMECGYYEGVRRQRDPEPSRPVKCRDGDRVRVRYRRPFKVARKSLASAEGLAMLAAECKRLGRAVTVKELAEPDCPCPTQSWFRTRYGSLGAALRLLGYASQPRGNPAWRKRGEAA